MYEKELKRIIEASQNNALTFFVGAGISALSGAPTWKGLIDSISEKLGWKKKDEISSEDFLRIPQMYYYSLGKNKREYYSFIRDQMLIPQMKPNRIHREMLRLDPASFITTNYDTLLEDAATGQCKSYKLVSCDEDVSSIFGDRFILKLHGDFKNGNFVLKEEDYLNYGENFKLIDTLLRAIFSMNTVVFIGYSLNDYNVKLILNWTKTLLKRNFREPIFIYTGNEALTDAELLYHESKGLAVIEWNKLIPDTDSYYERYQSVFDSLKRLSDCPLHGKSEEEAYEILYDRLKPLDRLWTLRFSDVSQHLDPYLKISDDGIIHLCEDGSLLMKHFLEIHRLSPNRKKCLPAKVLKKYTCIRSVFKKARISACEENGKKIVFVEEKLPFADMHCTSLDYNAMNAYVKKKYTSLSKNYKKAFYLSRLKRYDDAFFLFAEVGRQAYKEDNYLLYYLAQSNCIILHKLIWNNEQIYHCYDMGAIDEIFPNDTEIDNLFRRLPVDFRNTYSNLKDIHKLTMLYKYSYESFVDGQRLQLSFDSDSEEYDPAGIRKAELRIKESLHFLQGNGILADVFPEYKNIIKNLLSLLVYKYSAQGKRDPAEGSDSGTSVFFDEVDFYCFVDTFSDREIRELFRKCRIDTISFRNMEQVGQAVENLLDYYEYAVSRSKNRVAVIGFQEKIKVCLTLLGYMELSQRLVEQICIFILCHEFEIISVKDKIRFLDAQLKKRNMASEITAEVVENTLISCLDRDIAAAERAQNTGSETGTTEAVRPHNTGSEKGTTEAARPQNSGSDNTKTVSDPVEHKYDDKYDDKNNDKYNELVFYISPNNENYVVSRRLSMRISKIMTLNLSGMYRQITVYFWDYVSESQKNKIRMWAKHKLIEDFNFDIFEMLLGCNARIDTVITDKLREYLREELDKAAAGGTVYTDDKGGTGGTIGRSATAGAVVTNPAAADYRPGAAAAADTHAVYAGPFRHPYDKLVQIGVYCLLGKLKADDFKDFLGRCAAFDFYCEYAGFDFDRFDVFWLTGLYGSPDVLEEITKNRHVQGKIRGIIARELREKELSEKDRSKLESILISYFC